MKNLIYKKGYALLFTMVIVSVILVIATGISSNISKQLVLSSTALDSQIAFYQADTAGECAIYMTTIVGTPLILNAPYSGQFDCGLDRNSKKITLDVTETSPGSGIFTVDPNSSLQGPCFRIEIDESGATSIVNAYGYNTCDINNRRAVERGIEITY